MNGKEKSLIIMEWEQQGECVLERTAYWTGMMSTTGSMDEN